MLKPSVILLDIEGTTTPIDFVTEVLFPYARARMHPWLRARVQEAAFAPTLRALVEEAQEDRRMDPTTPMIDVTQSADVTAQTAAAYACWLMDHDRKSTPLKQVQGEIWQTGYVEGRLKSIVYPDAVRAIKRWKGQGKTVAIYSSGSVQAQKLLFGYAEQGDLRPWIDAYFDTTTGPKKVADSYTRIAQQLDVVPSSVTFVSDNAEELAAASAGGMQVFLAVRPGNAPVDDERFLRLEHFDALYA